ncbi:hypothetical protein [Streptomyces phaeochromogenes]|uniref:hypothetical protein n=1 Tax=Streptomyces phaeochromogenes TaxID=1923 RepID=UPI00398D13A9
MRAPWTSGGAPATPTRIVVAVGRSVTGNHNDCEAWELSGAKTTAGRTTVITDRGYRRTGLAPQRGPQ